MTSTMEKEKLSYAQASQELEKLVELIRTDNTDIDTLVSRSRHAAELIDICRKHLLCSKEELDKVIESLNSQQQ